MVHLLEEEEGREVVHLIEEEKKVHLVEFDVHIDKRKRNGASN